MASIVIIAEKPSLAKNIAQAIGNNFQRKNGYYENKDYIITYAYGHLFRLYDLDMYRDNYQATNKYPWKLEELPFFPKEFRFGLQHDEGIIKQFKIIRELINNDEVTTLVNAGDSDREGEIIVRLVIKYALKNDKSIKRLWMPDQTPKTINQELSAMKDDSQYDSLANEGLARTFVDWCFGINLTRFATIKSSTLLRVGRVITPIVSAIYDKEMEIINFVSKKYYVPISKCATNGEEIELVSKKEFSKEELFQAQELCQKYNQTEAVVTDLKSEKKIIPSEKLFSLSKLQGVLGKKFKMSLDESLGIVQSLYEKGFCSYPRTPSQYLATNEKGKIKEIIANFQKLNVDIHFKDHKNIFDDSKIESHSALTPTYKIPKKSELSEKEYLVYKTIVNRFFAVFSKENYEISRTTMEIKLGEYETFKLNGDVVLTKGWTKFEEKDKKENILPNLKCGDKVIVNFNPVEKETKPPKRYSVETFNNFLKNPFKSNLSKENLDMEEDDIEEYKAMFLGVELGTEATRSSIIDNAIKSKYISLKDNVYKLEPGGKYYVETLNQLNANMPKEKTAELGKALKRVFRSEITIDDAVELAKKEISEIIKNNLDVHIDLSKRVYEFKKEQVICKCIHCGKEVIETSKGFRCTNPDCGKALYFDNKLFLSLKKKVTKKIAKEIFSKGRTQLIDCVSKSGSKFDVTLVANFEDKYLSFKFEFDNKQENG